MTARKHLKQLVRSRMQKTGESYTAARRQIVRDDTTRDTESAAPWHFPGNVPGTTALRILLANAGIRDPRTGKPFTEETLFGIAGGIGIGVFAFYYEKEDFASFFVAGRHLWQDDQGYLESALGRFGIQAVTFETGGAGAAAKQLVEAISQYGPVVAWVDMANLPHRAMPESWSGGGYHVIIVHSVDESAKTALIGDLTDDHVEVSLADLARARERIKKQKNRLLAVPAAGATPDQPALMRGGLKACIEGLTSSSGLGAKANFQLGALKTWAERMHGSTGKESWDHAFKPGVNLWRGLTSIYSFIEHYGTGGGLSRPLFADYLRESAAGLSDARVSNLADLYDAIGRQWSELADAALPDSVPAFKEAKELTARRSELTLSGGDPEEIRATWSQLEALQEEVSKQFPLPDTECDSLRAELKERILAIHAD
jgi:hypothetical protein